MMDYILGLVDMTSVFLLLGSSVLFFELGWFFSKENEKIGNSLAVIGAVMIIAAIFIVVFGSYWNAPESWFRGLPAGEKVMMRNHINKNLHRPVSLSTFRRIQRDYYAKVYAETERKRLEQRDKEESPSVAKQLKAMVN